MMTFPRKIPRCRVKIRSRVPKTIHTWRLDRQTHWRFIYTRKKVKWTSWIKGWPTTWCSCASTSLPKHRFIAWRWIGDSGNEYLSQRYVARSTVMTITRRPEGKLTLDLTKGGWPTSFRTIKGGLFLSIDIRNRCTSKAGVKGGKSYWICEFRIARSRTFHT